MKRPSSAVCPRPRVLPRAHQARGAEQPSATEGVGPLRLSAGEQTIADVWSGRVVSVPGRIYYGQSGKPTRIEASDVRAKEIPEIDIQDVLDPDFTSGLSPVEYLQRLHEGNLG